MRIPDPDPDDCLTMRSKESEKICLHSTYLYQSWKSDEKILDHNQKELKIDDLTAKVYKRTYVRNLLEALRFDDGFDLQNESWIEIPLKANQHLF